MTKLARLRFAPSPTGSLHLGGLRTALFNHLLARKWGGQWMLRIEDTDQNRLVPGSVDEIRRGLDWAGLEYDEGPGAEGRHGPYFQSERLELYTSHTSDLLEADRAYRCFCDPSTLAATRLRLQQSGSTAGYDRTCSRLERAQVRDMLALKKPFCVRLLTPDAQPPSSPDLVFGNPTPHAVPVDPIIMKRDGFPTYHLANVVDDHAMEITHVLRGEEWLPSVPLHLTLYSAFGWTPPAFAHLPLLLNPDGSKMSKRTGLGAFVSEYIEGGWEPEAVLNWLAIAGWGGRRDPHAPIDPGSIPDVMSLPELISKFDLDHITHRRTVLAPSKLAHLNKQHLAIKLGSSETRQELVAKAERLAKVKFPESPYVSTPFVERVLLAVETHLTTLSDFDTAADYLFQEPDYVSAEAVALERSVPTTTYNLSLRSTLFALESLTDSEWTEAHIMQGLQPLVEDIGGMKQLMSPLRHALTARKAGVSVAVCMELLGKPRTMARLAQRAESS